MSDQNRESGALGPFKLEVVEQEERFVLYMITDGGQRVYLASKAKPRPGEEPVADSEG